MKKTKRRGRSARSSRSSRTKAPGNLRTKAPTGNLRIQNRYDAGAIGRRLGIWQPGAPGPNRAMLQDIELMRARSRDATRNNGWIKKGIIRLFPTRSGPASRRDRARMLNRFARRLESCGTSGSKSPTLTASMTCTGFRRLPRARASKPGKFSFAFGRAISATGLVVPLQLQLVEPEFCPTTLNETLPMDSTRKIRAGIEFNGIGKRTAYWMHRSHPGEAGASVSDIAPVPAASLIHHYAPLRPGQVRGVVERASAHQSARLRRLRRSRAAAQKDSLELYGRDHAPDVQR